MLHSFLSAGFPIFSMSRFSSSAIDCRVFAKHASRFNLKDE